MGITERKEREKGEMRKLILKAAMKLFLEEGYYNVTIRKIADKIEYSPATIYLYFKDKDEILYALHNDGFEELYKRQQKVLSIKDPGKRLRKQGELYIKFAFEHPEYYNLMFITRGPARKIVENEEWNAGRRSYEVLKTNVQEVVKAGIFRNVDVEIAAFALWSLAHGIVSLILRNRCSMMDQKSLPTIANEALAFITNSIGV